MFAKVLKESSAISPKDVRSAASRKAWLKRQRARKERDAEPHADHHRLATHYDKYDDPNVTVQDIMDQFSTEDRGEVALALIKAKNAPTSMQDPANVHQDGPNKGQFTEARKALHRKIIEGILTDEAIAAATPADGEAPTFIVLGGRGGSGKSSFTWGRNRDGTEREPKVGEFDSRKFLVLDSDAIKERLKPPYKGWNAFSVHEESGVIFDQLTEDAARMGLNFIHDATLKSKSVKSTIDFVKEVGYRVEGHYMFVPRQVSAVRAVKRYLGKGPQDRGRLVPPEVILENTQNERNFDSFLPEFDHWSAYDNQGTEPKLISRKKGKKS